MVIFKIFISLLMILIADQSKAMEEETPFFFDEHKILEVHNQIMEDFQILRNLPINDQEAPADNFKSTTEIEALKRINNNYDYLKRVIAYCPAVIQNHLILDIGNYFYFIHTKKALKELKNGYLKVFRALNPAQGMRVEDLYYYHLSLMKINLNEATSLKNVYLREEEAYNFALENAVCTTRYCQTKQDYINRYKDVINLLGMMPPMTFRAQDASLWDNLIFNYIKRIVENLHQQQGTSSSLEFNWFKENVEQIMSLQNNPNRQSIIEFTYRCLVSTIYEPHICQGFHTYLSEHTAYYEQVYEEKTQRDNQSG